MLLYVSSTTVKCCVHFNPQVIIIHVYYNIIYYSQGAFLFITSNFFFWYLRKILNSGLLNQYFYIVVDDFSTSSTTTGRTGLDNKELFFKHFLGEGDSLLWILFSYLYVRKRVCVCVFVSELMYCMFVMGGKVQVSDHSQLQTIPGMPLSNSLLSFTEASAGKYDITIHHRKKKKKDV